MESEKIVLVTAAAGGTGRFVVQLEKLAGNTVVATCGGGAKAKLLKELGVDRVIDYNSEDLKTVAVDPTTRVHKRIPLSPFGPNLYDAEYFYGFGYDPSTQDYLVVSLSLHDSEDPPLQLEYFSLKANKWKQVEGPYFPYSFKEEEPKGGLLYNGAIHWVAFRYDLQTDVILAFDLIERKLSYMLLPTDSEGSSFDCGLWVYGEFLSAYTKYYPNSIKIWVMNDYKVNSSWTMTHVLPIDVFFPLSCTISDDIIGTYREESEDGLVKYDKSGRCLEQLSYPNYDLSGLTMYMDSLLSLSSDDYL